MDRSETPTLLFPLLALLAIAFPFAMHRTASSSGGNYPQAGQAAKHEVNKEGNEQARKTQPHTAARLIEEFLQARSHPSPWLMEDPRNDYSLHFMIAIAADPIDSRLPRMFDSSVDSIQRAFEADKYVLDRFDLAWSAATSTKTDTGKSTGNDAKGKIKEEVPRYRRLPSLLLFRKPPDLKKEEKSSPKKKWTKGKLYLVFLVGETPTSGIHKDAMASALHQLASFFSWEPGHKKLPRNLQGLTNGSSHADLPIRIMGPSFTGSATSLEFALRDWLAGLPKDVKPRIKLRIISGSATAIDPAEFCRLHAGGHQTFQAVVPPDNIVMPRIFSYIRGLGRGRAYKRVALLSEANTAYGQQKFKGILNLPFPLHISDLRTASEKQRESQQASNSNLLNTPTSWVHLNEEQASQPKETPPSFSGLGAASSELVLSRLLSTISHERIHAVGILATDVRDVLFLAREIHQHCPGTLVFTVASDLLYSHPDVTASTRGMLVFTPYPLFNPNQVWTPPFLGLGNRFQFRSQDAEGDYNATLALLDRNDLLLDYGQPFPFYPGREATGPQCAQPALWVTVVGRHGPLPVQTICWNDTENYSVHVNAKDAPDSNQKPLEPPTLHDEGIYRGNTVLGMVLLSVVLIGVSWLVIFRYHVPERLEGPGGPGLASRLLGEPLTPEYRRQVRLFLLASLVCLLAACIVLAAVFSLPTIASWSLGTLPPLRNHKLWWTGFLLVSIVITAGLLSLSAAAVEVLRAFRKAPRRHNFLQLAVKRLVFWGCLVAFLFSVRLAFLVWLPTAWTKPAEGIFTYIRAFQFFSGLSPMVPLFCVALAGILWAVCSFRRLRMIDGLRPAGPETGVEKFLLRVETESFNGVKDLENKVRGNLERAWVLPKGWYAVVIILPLFILAATYLFAMPFVPSYEGYPFYFLFGWSFLLVYAALTAEFGRLCLTWKAFRHLLQRLALHPMREAFGRYRASFPGLPRIDLVAPLKAFSVLSFSVDQAERLLRMAPDLVSSDKISEAHRQRLERWIPGAWLALWNANKHLSRALEENSNGKWRLAITERSRAQQALGRLTQMTAELLEPSWRAPKNTPSLPMESDQFKEFRELAEEFLAGRVVLLTSYVLPSLRKLGTFIVIGLLLMLASVMFYPLVQKNHFLAFNWVVILGSVVLALVVTIEMERDVVLSALNGTTPGHVKMSRQFTFRILTYVMIPILALLSAQFPDTLGQIISWFTAFQGH